MKKLAYLAVLTTLFLSNNQVYCTHRNQLLTDTSRIYSPLLEQSNPLLTPTAIIAHRQKTLIEHNQHLIKKSQLTEADKKTLLGYYATHTFDEFPQEPGTLSFSPCGHHLALACHQSEQISIWESSTTNVFSTRIATLHHHNDWVTACLFSPCGRYFASASQDKRIHILDAHNLDAPDIFSLAILKHQAAVTALAFSPCGTYLLSGTNDNKITLWKLIPENNALRASPLVTRNSTQSDLSMKFSFSPSGRHIAIGSRSHPSVYLFETGTFCNHNTLPCITLTNPSADRNTHPTAIAFSPSTAYLAVGLSDHSVALWNMDSIEQEQVLPQSTSSMSNHLDDIPFPLFDVLTAYTFSDELIQLNKPRHFWCDLTNSLQGNTSMPLSLSFSIDNRYLAAGYLNGTARFWDLAHLNESPYPLNLTQHNILPIRAITFVPLQPDTAVTRMNIYFRFCLLEPDYIRTLIHLLETTPQTQRKFYSNNPTYHFSHLSQEDQIIVRTMPHRCRPSWIQEEIDWIEHHATPITAYHNVDLTSEQEIEYYCNLGSLI